MKTLFLLMLASRAWAIDGIPTMNGLTRTSGAAQSYTAGVVAIQLSQTANLDDTPLTIAFSAVGPGTLVQYDLGYSATPPTQFFGFLALSTTVMIDKLDPNLYLYLKASDTGPINYVLRIFGERK